MRKLMFVCSVAALAGSAFPAFAGGGMGDSAKWLREQNAICDAQRRGEGPRYPNMCQQEFPPGAVSNDRTH